MAPVDRMVERKLAVDNATHAEYHKLQAATAEEVENEKMELEDPLLDREERGEPKAAKKEEVVEAVSDDRPRDMAFFLGELRSFSAMFWVLTWCCLVVYGCILPFNNIASSLLQVRGCASYPSLGCLGFCDELHVKGTASGRAPDTCHPHRPTAV